METTRASLLIRIRNAGDANAWREFDAIYRPMLYRYAVARGLDHATAEDVAQHCMAAVNEHIARFDYDPRKGRFKGWLRTMVNNRVRNLYRDRRDRIAESRDFKIVQSTEHTPEETFDQIWMDEHLKHCLRLVREEVEATTFQAFQLYVIEERPIDEVCEKMNMNANRIHAIKWRMTRRLRLHMRELLAGME